MSFTTLDSVLFAAATTTSSTAYSPSAAAAAAATAAKTAAPFTFIIDAREKDVIAEMERYAAHYRERTQKPFVYCVEMLALGDAAARRADGTYAYIGERKTLTDMAASLAPSQGTDERYHSQKSDMMAKRDTENTFIEYMFEVPTMQRGFMDAACNDMRFGRTNVRASSLRGMVNNTRYRDKIDAVFTTSEGDTARHLLNAFLTVARFDGHVASTLSAEERQLVVSKTKKRRLDNATPVTLLADALRVLPLVGDASALALAKKFGSLAALMGALPAGDAEFPDDYRALVKKLGALFDGVPDVGAKTALSIYMTLHGRPLEDAQKPVAKKRAPPSLLA
jgi:ERCC4-type nuclease